MSKIKQDRLEIIGWSASAIKELTFAAILMHPARSATVTVKCLQKIVRQSFYILIGR
jgi:hypothetical protein